MDPESIGSNFGGKIAFIRNQFWIFFYFSLRRRWRSF